MRGSGAQAHNPIPEDAWEYQIRKALNDAAYNGLQYVPYCSTMPVQEKCDEPKFMWASLLRRLLWLVYIIRLLTASNVSALCRRRKEQEGIDGGGGKCFKCARSTSAVADQEWHDLLIGVWHYIVTHEM